MLFEYNDKEKHKHTNTNKYVVCRRDNEMLEPK